MTVGTIDYSAKGFLSAVFPFLIVLVFEAENFCLETVEQSI
jgi:hypothetical protein